MNPDAVRVMAEVGVDISMQRSKRLDEIEGIVFDYVVTVCSNANRSCPTFPARTKVVHVGFEDPPPACAERPDRGGASRSLPAGPG